MTDGSIAMTGRHWLTAAAIACVFAMTGCGGGGAGPLAGDGADSPDATAATSGGWLNLAITDAPVDAATRVVVVFTGVEIKPAGGEPVSVDYCADPIADRDDCRSIDLLQLRGGATADLLSREAMASGEYEWVRLRTHTDPTAAGASYIETENGTIHNLMIPAGAEAGLKLTGDFGVSPGETTRMLIDFDLRKSIVVAGGRGPGDGSTGKYLLKPQLRLMQIEETAAVAGDVDLAELAEKQERDPGECAGGVYVFPGTGATPDDQDGDSADGTDPIVYDRLAVDPLVGGTVASYRVPFVDGVTDGADGAGYTVAFTCDFDVDADPDRSEYGPGAAEGAPGFDTMRWTTIDVTVHRGETAIVDFPIAVR